MLIILCWICIRIQTELSVCTLRPFVPYFGQFSQSLRIWANRAVQVLAIGDSDESYSKVEAKEKGRLCEFIRSYKYCNNMTSLAEQELNYICQFLATAESEKKTLQRRESIYL